MSLNEQEWALIEKILKRGNTVELKWVRGQLHVVEIKRSVVHRKLPR